MFNVMTQLSMMAAQSAETTEERVDRLEQLAEESDVDENVLYDVENDLRGLVKHELQTVDGERAEQVEQLREQAPAMLGVEADQVDDVVAVIVARMLVHRPRLGPRFVHCLDEIYLRNGLYEELGGVETPAPGELNQPIDVDVDDVQTDAGVGPVDDVAGDFGGGEF